MSNCAVTRRELPYLEPSKKNAHYVVVSEKVLKKKDCMQLCLSTEMCVLKDTDSPYVCVCVLMTSPRLNWLFKPQAVLLQNCVQTMA